MVVVVVVVVEVVVVLLGKQSEDCVHKSCESYTKASFGSGRHEGGPKRNDAATTAPLLFFFGRSLNPDGA